MHPFSRSISKPLFVLISLVCSSTGSPLVIPPNKVATVAVIWSGGKPSGEVMVKYGVSGKIRIEQGSGKVQNNRFSFQSAGEARLEISFADYSIHPGSGSTLVTVKTKERPFSFFLRDVNSNFPIFIPQYDVVVVPASDRRLFGEIKLSVEEKNILPKLQTIESESEESFESAARITRNQPCPTWLGTGRDIRIFQVDYARTNEAHEFELITPKLAAEPLILPQLNNQEAVYAFATGRGQGPVLDVTRRLVDGVLPILHTRMKDEDISYSSICFTSLEASPLSAENLKGTNYLIADHYSYGHMFTDDQQELVDRKLDEYQPDEETVLYFRVVAENHSSVPRYAWYKTPRPGRGWWSGNQWKYDGVSGFSKYDDGTVFCISKLNGNPLPDEELAILLAPGEKASFEFFLPHKPVSPERAGELRSQSFDQRYQECRQFWKKILDAAPSIHLPEKRIEEMMYAGLLHLNLVTYGNEPDGTLAPCIGVYSPIGTESSPIIQYYNSMGWHDISRRSLQYFLDKQHPDGMIQNFGGYMVETGAALWSMGEYFRYTHDLEWVRSIEPNLLKACEFLTNWRKQNQAEGLKSIGFGMIAGKVADPNDDYHQFMLNAYAYLGMKRAAEMLQDVDPANSEKIRKEAAVWRSDIRDSFFNSMANSPVVPLGDGTWCPTVAPWTESTGPQALYVDKGNSFSHGTFMVRDELLGPMYLIFCEVLDPEEEASVMMLDYHTELFYQNNAAFSQPYYSRHAWLELKRGLVKPFLKTYYTTVSSLADRETYTFWEHLYHVSSHKTHEEAWFMMETRWMLYMEERDTLKLLPGIPRNWLENGKEIDVKNMASYFGPISFHITSRVSEGLITAEITCQPDRNPAFVVVRIPHPGYLKARSITGGNYDPETESVMIESFTGKAMVELRF